MAKESAKSAQAIETLLEERLKIEQWLERLAQTSNSTPEGVRERVEADYRRRLQQVVTELQSYRDEILASLERQKTVRSGLMRQERDATERLAEAELRHMVGEFNEGQWNELQSEILGALEKIREELRSVSGEVSDLEEVMALLGAGPRVDVGGFAKLVKSDTLEARDSDARVEMPGSGAAGLDDLEFLKAVSEDETQGPAPARASGEMRVPDEVSDVLQSQPAAGVDAGDVTSYADAPGQPKKGVAKTLKCGECGAMNLPTEWYCERCGAELAAL